MDRLKRGMGFTIIEVMLFFAVTGALMLGVLGTATVGINTQRYNDAVNTFSATVQQEFTNVTNVVNTKSIENMCGPGSTSEQPRGISNCVIIGRLMTIDNDGTIVKSNLIGEDPGSLPETLTELEVVRSYQPKIDDASQETETMNWDTAITKGNPPATSEVAVLIVRSPRSGNVYSYIVHTSLIATNSQLDNMLGDLIAEPTPPNGTDQYMCVDRSGWVATATRAVKLAPFASGPNGVSLIDAEGSECN